MTTEKSYNLFGKPWIKYLSILLIGLFFKLLSDVIFSLIYRNYDLIQPAKGYFGAILITWAVIEMVLLTNKWIDKRFPWQKHLSGRFVLQLGVTVIIALVLAEVLRWTLISLFSNEIYIKLTDELIIAIMIILFSLSFVFIQLEVFLLNRWRLSLSEIEKFKKENAEIRFETLRAQINPHFLFNSLNTLSSLIYTDQQKAEIFIRELSDVYRHILDKRDSDLVEIGEELKFLKSFIYLIKLRFESNLSVHLNINEEYNTYLIIPMSLQLLVENAVKHNVISKNKPLSINIYIDLDNYIVVTNNLQIKSQEQYSSGMGLSNIKSRYGYIIEREVIIKADEETFTVKLPLIDKNEYTDH